MCVCACVYARVVYADTADSKKFGLISLIGGIVRCVYFFKCTMTITRIFVLRLSVYVDECGCTRIFVFEWILALRHELIQNIKFMVSFQTI